MIIAAAIAVFAACGIIAATIGHDSGPAQGRNFVLGLLLGPFGVITAAALKATDLSASTDPHPHDPPTPPPTRPSRTTITPQDQT